MKRILLLGAPSGLASPLVLSGCQMWLAADLMPVVADGTAESAFTDQSPGGNNATQATGANQPLYKTNQINGLPTLLGDATNDNMLLTSAINAVLLGATYTVVMVTKNATATGPASGVLLQAANASSSTRMTIQYDASSKYVGQVNNAANSSSTVLSSATTADTTPHVLALVVDTSPRATFYVDGAQAATSTNVGAGTAGTNQAIFAKVGASNPSNAHVADLVVYNRALARSELTRLHKYYRRKYGISVAV